MFPALLHCTVDWFHEWPSQALRSVATTMLRETTIDLGTSSEKIRSAIADTLVYIHNQVEYVSQRFSRELRRTNYITPTLFIDLVKNYLARVESHREEINRKLKRLEDGLRTVIGGNQVVTEMKTELQKLQPVLEQAVQEAEELSAKVPSLYNNNNNNREERVNISLSNPHFLLL